MKTNILLNNKLVEKAGVPAADQAKNPPPPAIVKTQSQDPNAPEWFNNLGDGAIGSAPPNPMGDISMQRTVAVNFAKKNLAEKLGKQTLYNVHIKTYTNTEGILFAYAYLEGSRNASLDPSIQINIHKAAATLTKEQLIQNIDKVVQEITNIHERLAKEIWDSGNPVTKSEHVNKVKSELEKAVVALKSHRGYVERLGEAVFKK